MPKFRKKPVIIEAIQFTMKDMNITDISKFTKNKASFMRKDEHPVCVIPTLEGDMIASIGDWIIKGVKGEFYPCKPDIFKQTYEAV